MRESSMRNVTLVVNAKERRVISIALTIYILIGIFLVTLGPFRKMLSAEVDRVVESSQPASKTKVMALRLTGSTGIALLWPIFSIAIMKENAAKKNEPQNALEALIHITYGNPPPNKSAKVKEAIDLAYKDLLGERIFRSEVTELAIELNDTPMPYSTYDLALAIALNFFTQKEKVEILRDMQLIARGTLFNWRDSGTVNLHLAKTFEDSLYKTYKS